MKLFITMRLLSSFSDYYGRNEQQSLNNIQFFGDHDFAISNCNFNKMIGGALSYNTNEKLNMLVESCLFFNCTSNDGGAICFKCPYGAFVLDKCCAAECYTQSGQSYQFGNIQVENSALKFNIINLFTMTKCCPSDKTGRSYGIYILYGTQNVTNYNASKNYCATCSTLVYNSYNPQRIKFSMFVDNVAISSYTFMKQTSSDTISMFCNIIDNICPGNIVYTDTVLVFEDSIFQGNSQILFYAGSSITLKRGWVCHPLTMNNAGTIYYVDVANALNKTNSLSIAHYTSAYCKHDELGGVIPPSPTECAFESNNQAGILNMVNIIGALISGELILE